MGQVTASKTCAKCGPVLAVGNTPNHVLHFLITLFTCGVWVVMWALIAFAEANVYRCPQCGGPAT